MAKNITFHLPACDVHTGVQRRESASIAADALAGIRAQPLLGSRCSSCQAAADPPVAGISMRFAPVRPPQPPQPQVQPHGGLTFASMLGGPVALRTVDAALLGVARLAPRPVADVALGLQRRMRPPEPAEPRCQYVDQYSVGDPDQPASWPWGRFAELLHGVLVSNVVPLSRVEEGQVFSRILGPTGHYERFSAWSHVAGFVGLVGYAVGRQILASNRSTVEGVLVSVAAWTTALVFLASSLYHTTSPDIHFAAWTRVLDFMAIYVGLVTSATADVAVATRGFADVPVVTIVDIPVAGLLMVLFFVWRRARTPKDHTWEEDYADVPRTVECSLGRGLFRRGHTDLHHSSLREATSLLLTAAYFMVVPAAVMTLGAGVSAVVIGLQVLGFVLLTGGMVLDRVLEWPNASLVQGEQACCYPNGCGCVLTSHGVWHLIALVSAAATVVAREYAMSSY